MRPLGVIKGRRTAGVSRPVALNAGQGFLISTSSVVMVFLAAGMLWTDRAKPPGMSSTIQVSVIVSPASTRPFDLYHVAWLARPITVIGSFRSSTVPGGRVTSFLARSVGAAIHRA